MNLNFKYYLKYEYFYYKRYIIRHIRFSIENNYSINNDWKLKT